MDAFAVVWVSSRQFYICDNDKQVESYLDMLTGIECVVLKPVLKVDKNNRRMLVQQKEVR